jgi:4-oxalocrotonate tautomerase
MPIITARFAKGRSIEAKRAFVQEVTEAAVRTLGVKPEWVSVLIEEFEREDWASGGELHSDKFGPGFGKAGTGA